MRCLLYTSSITGPREDIDRVVNNYLSRYEIHLENALTELTDVKNLSPYLEINPYKEALSTVGSFYEEVENPEQAYAQKLPIEKDLSFVQQIKDEADVLNKTRQELEEKRDSLAESLRIIYPCLLYTSCCVILDILCLINDLV